MRGCLAPIRRAAAGLWLLPLLGLVPTAAIADTTARGYQPAVNHLSVVVTTDQVYVTWTDPAGVQPTGVFAYRSPGSSCPTGSSDGTPIGNHTVTNHMIDGTVQAGLSYCYTVFVRDSAGSLVKVGSTGAVPVPDLTAPPPAAAPATTPVPQSASSSSSGLRSKQVKAMVASVGGLLAIALLVLIARMFRRSRTADAGPAWGTDVRMSLTGLSASALIIPAVIVLAWVLVTVVVVFR